MYSVRGEVSSGKADDLCTYLIVMFNYETSVAVSERVMHKKGLQETVTFLLKVRGVNVITSP